MTEIILEKKYDARGKYLGKIVVHTEDLDLNPEFLAKLKADKDDKHGWHKYRQVMKDAGYKIEAEPI